MLRYLVPDIFSLSVPFVTFNEGAALGLSFTEDVKRKQQDIPDVELVPPGVEVCEGRQEGCFF
jgi:hypothetical protein